MCIVVSRPVRFERDQKYFGFLLIRGVSTEYSTFSAIKPTVKLLIIISYGIIIIISYLSLGGIGMRKRDLDSHE